MDRNLRFKSGAATIYCETHQPTQIYCLKPEPVHDAQSGPGFSQLTLSCHSPGLDNGPGEDTDKLTINLRQCRCQRCC